MTPDVARFLLAMLDRQTITIGADDAEQIARLAFEARRQLLSATVEGDPQ